MQFILDNRVTAQFITMAIVTFLAIWKGGGPERAIGAVVLGMFLSANAYHRWFNGEVNLGSINVFFALLDGVVAIALIAIALRANRVYPLCIAGLQIIALAAHLAREIVEAMTPIAYAILFILPSYFQILVLGAGLWAHRRRVAKYGQYKEWRTITDGPGIERRVP